MKPLSQMRDLESSDTIVARAVKLLATERPLSPSPAMQARVRSAVMAHAARGGVPVRVAFAAFAVFLLTGAASAMLVRQYIANRSAPFTARPVSGSVEPSVGVAAPALPGRVANSPAVIRKKIRSQAAARGDENVLVLEATRALRRLDDPQRALTLIHQYLGRHPHGELAEEAIALGMEAATAAGTRGAARSFAIRYLDSFPDGRFASAARDALAGKLP